MTRLEDITRGCSIRGILPEGLATVLDVKWLGTVAIEVTYKDSAGRLGNELLYRDREPTLEIAEAGRPWSFDGDGALFRLLSEANRIRLAYLFDPLLAVHTSLVDPLPHQITAVYGEMLSRQPLRFLLADDPGAGKTIMTGLFIKELMARGDSAALPDRLPRQSCRAMAGRTRPPVPPAVRDHDERRARSRTHRQLVQRERFGHLSPRQAQPRRGRPGQAPADRLGPDRLRRSPQAQRHLLRQRGQVHQALPARPVALDADPPFPAADSHAAQRQRGRLPAIHGLARRRPLRGQIPRRRPRLRLLRHDAAAGQGATAQVRRHAAVPGTPGLHGQLRPVGRRSRTLQASHRLRPRGIQPGRGAGKRWQQRNRRLRVDHPATPARVVARSHLPVPETPPGTAGKATSRRAASQARRRGPASI